MNTLIPIILIFGCFFIFCIGTGLASWATSDIAVDGPDIKSIVMLLVGIGIIVFSLFSVTKSSDYYHEKESPKTEITTSISPQIDTIITTRNSISDTVYIYKFNLTEK